MGTRLSYFMLGVGVGVFVGVFLLLTLTMFLPPFYEVEAINNGPTPVIMRRT